MSPEDIKAALMSMSGDMSPDPDGYNSFFIQKSWDVVGNDFSKAIASFLSHRRSLSLTACLAAVQGRGYGTHPDIEIRATISSVVC